MYLSVVNFSGHEIKDCCVVVVKVSYIFVIRVISYIVILGNTICIWEYQ